MAAGSQARHMHAFRCSSGTLYEDSLDQGWLLVDAPVDMPDMATNLEVIWNVCPSTSEVTATCATALRCVHTEAASIADLFMCIVMRRVRYVRNTLRARLRADGLHR